MEEVRIMREISLGELDKMAKEGTKRRRSMMKARYRYARDMGFSVAESIILQNKKETLIRKLADDRKRESAND